MLSPNHKSSPDKPNTDVVDKVCESMKYREQTKNLVVCNAQETLTTPDREIVNILCNKPQVERHLYETPG